MFSNCLSDNYVTKRFIIKGTEEELREILDNPEYDCTLIGDIQATRDYLFQMEIDEYSEIESIISEHPDVRATGFVEDWGNGHKVYVVFSDYGVAGITDAEEVGYFDGHNDYNWHDSCPILAMNESVDMSYSGEHEEVTYSYPFAYQWE